ncbi:MAG TPA: hypothetical protein VGU45_00295 [Microvirga sp.]|nr:hypothetical protein [Microvirga sp.]
MLAILTAPFVSSLCVLGAAFMTARRSRERLERLPRTLAATMTLPQSSSPIVLSGAKS